MKKLRPEVKESLRKEDYIDAAIDNAILHYYNVTLDEYDTICNKATDKEIEYFHNAIFSPSKVNFSYFRKALEIRNKYVEYYRNISE